jgi:hypothetical protein
VALEEFDTAQDAFTALKAKRLEDEQVSEDELEPELELESEFEEEPDELELEEESEDQPSPALDAPIGFQDVWEDLDDDVREVIAKKVKEADGLTTRKSEELTKTQAEVESERQRFAEERQRLAEIMAAAIDVPDLPDPDLMDPDSDSYDPDQYNSILAKRTKAMNKWKGIEEEIAKTKEEQQAAEQAALAESHVERDQYLSKEWPEFVDQAKGHQVKQSLLDYAETLGMNLEIMPYLSGPLIHALEKSRRYDAAKESGMKKQAPRSVRPSSPGSPKHKRTKKLDQMKRDALASGNVKDMQAYMRANRR